MASHDYQMSQYNNFKICKQICFLRSHENRHVLANLKTLSNKNVARSHFFNKSFNTTNLNYNHKENYNHSQNILRLFYLLVQFPFTSSETELDHYHYKLTVRVTLRIVKRLRKQANFSKITKFNTHIVQCPISLAEIKIWQQRQKIE